MRLIETPCAACLAQIEKLGFNDFPVCIAKTQYSLSDDPKVLGRPEGFEVTVKEIRISAGAGFIVVLLGDVMTMRELKRMKAQLIDGKRISAEIKAEAAEEAAALKAKGITPCLAVVLVGDDSASQVYVNNKKKACEAVGIRSVSHVLSGGTTEEALLELIAKLNADRDIHGILVQMPVPKQIDERKVILAIDPKKDVDCFHPVNVGNLHTGGHY